MRVVLDTSAICADFHFRSPDAALLWDGLGKTVSKMLLPAVALEEVDVKHREMLETVFAAIQKQEKEYARVSGEALKPRMKRSEIDRLNATYGRQIRQRFGETGCGIIPFPKVDHVGVVRRELRRKRPFSDRGAGYRDYLIWHSILDIAEADPSPIAFISHNTKDFSDGDTLHPDLVQDLAQKGMPADRVRFFKSISHFVEAQILPCLERSQRVLRDLAVGTLPRFNLKEWVRSEQEYLFTAEDIAAAGVGTSYDGFHARYLREPEIVQVMSEEVRLLNSGDVLVLVSLTVRAEVSVSSSEYDFDHYREVREFWQSRSGDVWTEAEVQVEVTFSILLDGEKYEVKAYETMSIGGPASSLEMSHHKTKKLLRESSSTVASTARAETV